MRSLIQSVRAGFNGEQSQLLRFAHQHRKRIGLSYRKLGVVGVLSVLAGFVQAGLLLVIVRGATALTAETESIGGTVGPLSASDLTTTDLIVMGFVLLVVLLALEIANSFAQASLSVEASRHAQHRMVQTFSRASFAAQTTLTRGEARQVVMAYPTYAGGVARQLGTGLSAAVNFLALVGSAVVLSPAAAGFVIVGLGLMLFALRPVMQTTKRLSDRRSRQGRSLSGAAAERFELTRELKSMGAESRVDHSLLSGIDAVARTDRQLRVLGRMSSVLYRLGAFALVLTMLAVIDASNSTSLAALTGALLMLLRSLSYGQAAQSAYQSLGEATPYVQQFLEEEDRLDASAEVGVASDAPPGFHIGDIALEGVTFAYTEGEPVLFDTSLRIEKGDFVALVGPSGAGKSTLMQLLLRLREPTAGEMTVNDVRIDEIPLGWWRSRVAYVAQEPRLQSGSVADAIRFGRSWITDQAISDAAARAHIADDIASWPDGYDTEVGQLGESLSGGQRQRLAIARALAGDPDLLLLDEPTSALDPRSEDLIAQTLEALRGSTTIVAVAHRLNTVESAGRAIVVRDGRLVDQGKVDKRELAASLVDDMD